MKYTVMAAITLHAGAQIIMSEAQALRRKHMVQHLGDNLYEVRLPVQFKAGEVIETDQELPKHMAALLDPAAVVREAKTQRQPRAPRAKAPAPGAATAPAPENAPDAPKPGDGNGDDSNAGGDKPLGSADAPETGAQVADDGQPAGDPERVGS